MKKQTTSPHLTNHMVDETDPTVVLNEILGINMHLHPNAPAEIELPNIIAPPMCEENKEVAA